MVILLSETSRKNVNSRKVSRAIVSNRLIRNEDPVPILDDDVTAFDVTISAATVPAKETTYWCTVVKLPQKLIQKKHHVVKVCTRDSVILNTLYCTF